MLELVWPRRRPAPSGRAGTTDEPLYSAYGHCSKGSFRAALDTARDQARLVLLIVADARSKDTQKMLEALEDAKLRALLGDTFVVWGSAAPSARAQTVAQKLGLKAALPRGASSPPLLAVVLAPAPEYDGDPRAPAPRVLSRHHCKPSPTGPQMAAWLNRTLKVHEGDMKPLRTQRELRELQREQSEQFAEGLNADRSRVRRQQQELEEQRAAEQHALAEAAESKRKLAETKRRRDKKRAALGPEPSADTHGANELTTVLLKLPDGSRVQRVFTRSDTLHKFLDWADTEGVDIDAMPISIAAPRRPLPEERGTTLAEAGLGARAMLVVGAA